jgi:Domain of unknown function (DUF1127).
MSSSVCTLDLDLPRESRSSRVARLWAALASISRTLANRRAANRLTELDDFMLADIGLTRDDIDQILRTSSLFEDPSDRLSTAAEAHAQQALPPV